MLKVAGVIVIMFIVFGLFMWGIMNVFYFFHPMDKEPKKGYPWYPETKKEK